MVKAKLFALIISVVLLGCQDQSSLASGESEIPIETLADCPAILFVRLALVEEMYGRDSTMAATYRFRYEWEALQFNRSNANGLEEIRRVVAGIEQPYSDHWERKFDQCIDAQNKDTQFVSANESRLMYGGM